MRRLFLTIAAALAVSIHGAAAQQNVSTQDAYFSGTCTGSDQSFQQPFATPFNGTVIGADILVFQGSGIQHGFAGVIAAAGSGVVTTLGLGEMHVVSFPGGGSLGAAPYYGTGFLVTTTSKIDFDIACTGGAWQAIVTYWYHTP